MSVRVNCGALGLFCEYQRLMPDEVDVDVAQQPAPVGALRLDRLGLRRVASSTTSLLGL